MKKDFSVRVEVKAMLENLGMVMTEGQIDDVINEIQQYDSFLSIVSLFVTKGIKDVCENNDLDYDMDELDNQAEQCSRGINLNDLV